MKKLDGMNHLAVHIFRDGKSSVKLTGIISFAAFEKTIEDTIQQQKTGGEPGRFDRNLNANDPDNPVWP